jgi:hypothetical protein
MLQPRGPVTTYIGRTARGAGTLCDQTVLQRLCNGLASRVNVKLFVNVTHVVRDRIDADPQFRVGGLVSFRRGPVSTECAIRAALAGNPLAGRPHATE